MQHIKSAFIFLLLAGGSPRLLAQQARETQVKFMKGQQSAITADYELPQEITEQALIEHMSKAGLGRNRTEKGFLTWKGVSWPEVSPDKVDVYALVEGRKDKSSVTLLVSKGYDNFISNSTDSGKAGRLKAVLESFDGEARAYKARMDIAAAEDLVRMTEADYNKTAKESGELEEDRRKLDKRLAENREVLAKKQKSWDEAKARLEGLRRAGGR